MRCGRVYVVDMTPRLPEVEDPHKKQPKLRAVAFRVPEDLLERLEAVAHERSMTQSELVRGILSAYLTGGLATARPR